MPDISVVLACYQGEKKIGRMLESLRAQICLPAEVLIRDDCSTDGTAAAVRAELEKGSQPGWTLTENERNLGWKRNFFEGMLQAGGDLIFLCDQDDVWDPRKIGIMAEAMARNPQISLLACDYGLHYDAGSVSMKKYRKKRSERTGETARYRFTSRFFQNPAPGCTYAVRRDFFLRVKDLWFPQAPHDEFLWLMAALEDGAWFLNRNLMTLWREEENASDIRYKDIPLQQENLSYIETMLSRMSGYAESHPDAVAREKREAVEAARIWCGKRQRLMETRNPFLWLAMAPYWKYYNSFRNCLSDLYLVLFGSFRRS